MKLSTASGIISFAMKLEGESINFYKDAAQKYVEARDIFLSFGEENKRNKALLKRVYYEVISDALETGFSFEGLNTDDYPIEMGLINDTNYSDVLRRAMEMEDRIQRFYRAAAEKSQSLMADIPRAFERIAKKRNERKLKLKLLQEDHE